MGITIVEKPKSWGQNAMDTLSTAKTNISSAVSSGVNKITNAFQDARSLVTSQTNNNTKTLSTLSPGVDDDYKDLFEIGRPCKFNSTIDPNARFGNYLRSKMSVIDLVPVDYQIEYKKIKDLFTSEKSSEVKDDAIQSIYKIDYDKNIERYQDLCLYHGLVGYTGLRLFTTDDTMANDTIQVQYKDSTFQGVADNFSDFGKTYQDWSRSILGSQSDKFNTNVSKIAVDTTKELAKELANETPMGSQMQDLLSNLVAVAGDVLLQGNKMTFPKIWQSTTYNGNLSVNIRLISPYGHPKAVKEFIMKPLSYLILLAAPRTTNTVTYGGNMPITIKAYGLNYTVIGSIASMTFRRGGSETSYNLYRQPLTIDVSLEFQTLFDAFAVYDDAVHGEKMKIDRDVFEDDILTDLSTTNMYTKSNKNSLMTSLGTILGSLRPVRVVGTSVDPQVYGGFVPPDRTDIPDGPLFVPLTGNLGSTISSAVSSVGNFAQMVTNAPKLIQQGLSNAVYNTAKGSVSTIVGTASSWINKPTSTMDSIKTKIIGNLF